MREQFRRLHPASSIKKALFHVEVDKGIIIKLKWNAQGKKGMILSVVRPGYRISSCTIKRGS
jgi:hypothetical protein